MLHVYAFLIRTARYTENGSAVLSVHDTLVEGWTLTWGVGGEGKDRETRVNAWGGGGGVERNQTEKRQHKVNKVISFND